MRLSRSRLVVLLWVAGCAPATAPDAVPSAPSPTSASEGAVAVAVPPTVDPRCNGGASRGPIEVAITVDDLPRHGKLPKGTTRVDIVKTMTDAFARHGVSGVYGFVNGARAETDDERRALEAWVQAGHNIANHGFSHTSADKLSSAAFLEELGKNEPILDPLRRSTKGTLRVYRFPYLHQGKDRAARDANVSGLRARGYRVGEVTMDFSDWAYTDPFTRCAASGSQEAIVALEASFLEQAEAALGWSDAAACSLSGRPIRHILLLHIGAFTALRMDGMLAMLKERGARFISLEEALEDPIQSLEPVAGRTVRGPLLHQIRAAKKAQYVPIPAVPDPALAVLCK